MELIDRKALINQLKEENIPFNADINEIINIQPIVFDTEKVVEQLEEVNMNYFLTIANTGSEKLDIAYGYASDSINKAIDIVKKGGVE